jgi:hypothetical protein
VSVRLVFLEGVVELRLLPCGIRVRVGLELLLRLPNGDVRELQRGVVVFPVLARFL